MNKIKISFINENKFNVAIHYIVTCNVVISHYKTHHCRCILVCRLRIYTPFKPYNDYLRHFGISKVSVLTILNK
jgi:hypothetical protein